MSPDCFFPPALFHCRRKGAAAAAGFHCDRSAGQEHSTTGTHRRGRRRPCTSLEGSAHAFGAYTRRSWFRAPSRPPRSVRPPIGINHGETHIVFSDTAPMLELHRSRFVEWQPAAVVALAVAPGGLTVALARENGDLEIYDTADWRCTARVPGHDGAAISSLAWCAPFDSGLDDDGEGEEANVAGAPPCRLLSAGLDGQIMEWDLNTLRARGATDSHGGSVWALASEPDVSANKPQRVAAACDDGCVRLLTLSGGNGVGAGLHHRRSFNRVDGRLLSLAWTKNSTAIAAGSSRGAIHIFDCATFTELARCTVGDGDRPEKADQDERCVWSLAYLQCGTLVSGSSDGDVTFWDKKHATKITSIRQHKADVLALAASPDGNAVFASGVDSQIAVFEKTLDGSGADGDTSSQQHTWQFTGTKRPHTHDVRTLAMAAAPSGDGASTTAVLLSGGNDAQLLAYPALTFRKRHPVRVVSTPERTPIAMTGGGLWTNDKNNAGKNAKGKKRGADDEKNALSPSLSKTPNPPLLLCDHARWLDLWRLGEGAGDPKDTLQSSKAKRHDGTMKLSSAPRHLLRARLGGKRRTTCSAVSPDGKLVAASDTHTLRLFEVRQDLSDNTDESDEGWTLRKKESFGGSVESAHLVLFTPDGKVLIAVGVTGTIHVIDLESWEVMESLRQHLPKPSAAAVALDKASRKDKRDDNESKNAGPVRAADVGSPAVSHACASADGQWLAVVTTKSGAQGRRSAGVHVYNLDALKLHASLPPPPGQAMWPPVAAVAFSADGVLALALRDNAVVAYDAEQGKITQWSAALADAKVTAPAALAAMPGQICGLSFDPTPGSSVLLCQTSSAIARVDLAAAPDVAGGPQIGSSGGHNAAPSPKRRRKSGKGGGADGKNQNNSKNNSKSGPVVPKVATLDDPCLFLGYFAPGRALLVERPWKEVLKQIPEPLYRHRFGT